MQYHHVLDNIFTSIWRRLSVLSEDMKPVTVSTEDDLQWVKSSTIMLVEWLALFLGVYISE